MVVRCLSHFFNGLIGVVIARNNHRVGGALSLAGGQFWEKWSLYQDFDTNFPRSAQYKESKMFEVYVA
jgi:hypothetical protein